MRAAVRELGIDRRGAQRAAKVDGLFEDAKAARDVSLSDNQSAFAAIPRPQLSGVTARYAHMPDEALRGGGGSDGGRYAGRH